MLKQNFALNISACLTGNSFSLDELITETRTLFEREGILGFLRVLIALVDEMVGRWISSIDPRYCELPDLKRAGKRSKWLYTSLGKLELTWSRLKCKSCGKGHYPLREFFGIDRHQSKSGELEKLCLEAISKESYRKSVQTIKTLRPVQFNHRTLHRWVLRSPADQINVTHSDLDVIVADGTKFKKFVPMGRQKKKNLLRQKLNLPVQEVSARGEVKIIMGITQSGEVRPLGAWTAESWKENGNLIHRANNPERRLAPVKLANILVADGEIGLGNGLKKLVHHKQRCLWHIPHELKPLMKYQDKAPEADVSEALGQMGAIFEIDIPEKDIEQVTVEEKVEINEKIIACEEQMKLLAQILATKGHKQAATYVDNMRSDMFTYLRFWMKTGVVTPRVSSKLERLMRELNRRIKKFAFNWSDRGAGKVTRILLKLICAPQEWEDYWLKRSKMSGNIRLTFEGIS